MASRPQLFEVVPQVFHPAAGLRSPAPAVGSCRSMQLSSRYACVGGSPPCSVFVAGLFSRHGTSVRFQSMRIWIKLVFIGAILTATSSLADQDSAPQPLGAAEQRALVLKIANLLRTEYVFAEVGERAAAELARRANTDAFDVPRSRADFAATVTRDLAELTGDKHVRVRFAPATVGTRTAQELDPSLDNFGVHRTEWLPDRIGYLKIDRFYEADESRASFDAALTLVGLASALIIDLRENSGGSDANNLLASYFFSKRILFNELRWRKMEPDRLWTDPSVRPRLTTTPVYILTSGRTFSAAEAFAYSMQQRKRAVVVGERTAGGANPNRYFPLAPGLAVSISVGTTVNPVSGANWEGTGVRPDIEVPSAAALDAATQCAGVKTGRVSAGAPVVCRELATRTSDAGRSAPASRGQSGR
jgi:hypothetical protein